METGDPLPRYAEIRQALEQAIISGAWPPGHRVPSEAELVERYACSRMTVNKALSALAAAGLIVRRRRAGSFVAARTSEETVLEIHDIRAEIAASGKVYRHVPLARAPRTATRADAARLGVAVGTRILALLARHDADGRPQVLEDRLLNLAAVPAARDEPFEAVPAGTWLLERIPWTAAEHHIRAVSADAAVARRLDLAAGTACLVVERTTWRDGDPITQVTLTYPGDRHTLVGRFSPSSAGLPTTPGSPGPGR